MSPSDSSRFNRVQIDDQVKQFALSQFRSMGLVHIVGYGLLLLTIVDFLTILLPPRFMNPTWEFQAYGQCIERIPVLFLAIVLIFFGESNPRGKIERLFVRLLSWMMLVLSIVCFLLIPVGIFNTIRIDQTNEANANFELSQQLSQLQQVRGQVERAKSTEELKGLVTLLRSSNSSSLTSTADLSQTRQRLLEILKNREQLFIADSNRQIGRQHRDLLKQSFKWNVGAVIAGTLLLLTWVNTGWAR